MLFAVAGNRDNRKKGHAKKGLKMNPLVMGEIVRLEREQMLQRAEQRARLRGYPSPPARRIRFLTGRHEHTGDWAPCNPPTVSARVCWYST